MDDLPFEAIANSIASIPLQNSPVLNHVINDVELAF